MLTDELIEFYKANGYVVVPALFSQAEVADQVLQGHTKAAQ